MDKYTIIKKLGSGSYGTANLALHNIFQNKYVIKSIPTSHLSKEDLINAKKEVQVLSGLVHEHITRFQESFSENDSLHIVMEYCAGGDMQSLISRRCKIYFPEDRILDWFTQLCLAVKFIHDEHILHRDIKTQNVFLTHDGKLKLGDFGIAKVLDQTNDLTNTCVGTPYYLSPEMCEGRPYSNKSDVWAIGCVLYEIAALEHAFEAANMKSLMLKISRCSYKPVPLKYSREFRNLISNIFQREPKKRPSVKALLFSKLLYKRLPRFITECDSEELKRNAPSKLRQLPLYKRIGLSAPAAKYGASQNMKKACNFRNSRKCVHSTKSNHSPISYRKNVSNRKATEKNDKKLSNQDIKLRYLDKENGLMFLPENFVNQKSSQICDTLAGNSKLKLMLADSDFNSMEISVSIYNNLEKLKDNFQRANMDTNPKWLKNLITNKRAYSTPANSFKDALLERVNTIVDKEVLRVTQMAVEDRVASYEKKKEGIIHNLKNNHNIQSINSEICSMEQVHVTPFNKLHSSHNRKKWGPASTPIFAHFPLEETISNMECSILSSRVPGRVTMDNSGNISFLRKEEPLCTKTYSKFERRKPLSAQNSFERKINKAALFGSETFTLCADASDKEISSHADTETLKIDDIILNDSFSHISPIKFDDSICISPPKYKSFEISEMTNGENINLFNVSLNAKSANALDCTSKNETEILNTDSSFSSNGSVTSKKRKRSFFRFFHKETSDNKQNLQSPPIQQLPLNQSPLSKTKSRFSGMFKKLLPKQRHKMVDKNVEPLDFSHIIETSPCNHVNILFEDALDGTSDHSFSITKDIDTITDSGVLSCEETIQSTTLQPHASDCTSIVSENSCSRSSIIYKYPESCELLPKFIDTPPDTFNQFPTDNHLKVLSGLRDTAISLVDNVIEIAINRLREKNNNIENLNSDSAYMASKDRESPLFELVTPDNRKDLVTENLNITSNTESTAVEKDVPPCCTLIVRDNLNNWTSKLDDNQPMDNFYSDETGSSDIYGWIEEKKAELEDRLGLDLFMECYRCLESAQGEDDACLSDAFNRVKKKLGLERETLAQLIFHIIVCEAAYSN